MKSFIYNSGIFIGKEGNETFFQNWTVENPEFKILVSHGIGYNSENFKVLLDNLEDKNISLYTYDHRGFGKSGGKAGHVENFVNLIYDLDIYFEMTRQFDKQTPIIVYGHSLGALIALNHMIMFPEKFNGAILSSPLLTDYAESNFWTNKILGKYLPKTYIKTENLIYDPIISVKQDNKINQITAGLNLGIKQTASHTINNIDEINIPILVLNDYSKQFESRSLKNNFYTLNTNTNKSQLKKEEVLDAVTNWSFEILSNKMKKRKIS